MDAISTWLRDGVWPWLSSGPLWTVLGIGLGGYGLRPLLEWRARRKYVRGEHEATRQHVSDEITALTKTVQLLYPFAKKQVESSPSDETSEIATWLSSAEPVLTVPDEQLYMDATQGSSVGEPPPELVKNLKVFLQEQPPPAGVYPQPLDTQARQEGSRSLSSGLQGLTDKDFGGTKTYTSRGVRRS